MGLLKAGITDRDKVCNEILSIAKREKLSLSQLVSVFDYVLYIIEQGNPVVVQSWKDIISEQDSNNS